jgi:hypothetical protein
LYLCENFCFNKLLIKIDYIMKRTIIGLEKQVKELQQKVNEKGDEK